MTLLLQVSDPHFGTERPQVVDALVDFVHRQTPGVMVLSGDITQRALPEEFRAARTFVDRLGVPQVLAVPGNHDIPLYNLLQRVFRPYARHRQAFGDELEPSFESPDLLVIALNTTRRYRHKHGEVSRAQVERVSSRLRRAAATQLRVVVTHQPVAVTKARDEVNLLRGHADAVRRWVEAGVDLILGGHIHLPFLVPLHQRDPGLPRKAWAVQAGTAVSNRLRHGTGNSVNLIRVTHGPAGRPRAAVVERWDFSDDARGFHRVSSDELAFGDQASP